MGRWPSNGRKTQMTLIKLAALAIAFIVSGGILFSEYFRSNAWVKGIAAAVAVVAFAALVFELGGNIFGGRQSPTSVAEPTTVPPKPLETAALPTKQPGSVFLAPLAVRAASKAIGFPADANQLYIIPEQGPILVWDRSTAAVKATKLTVGDKSKIGISPNRQWLVDVERNSAALVNLRGGTITKTTYPEIAYPEIISAVAVSNSGALLAIATYTRVVVKDENGQAKTDDKGQPKIERKPRLRILSMAAKKVPCQAFGHGDLIDTLEFSPDNTALVSAGWDKWINLVSIDCKNLKLYYNDRGAHSITLDATGKRVAVASYAGLQLYGTEKNTASETTLASLTDFRRVAFDNRGLYLAAGSKEGWVYLFDPGTRRELHSVKGHSDEIIDLSFPQGDEVVATLGKDGAIALWNPTNLERIATIYIFADSEWVVLFETGEFCASKDAARWLRVRTIKPGMLWNSTAEDPLSPEFTKTHWKSGCLQ
jgi:WD40 repeat protein